MTEPVTPPARPVHPDTRRKIHDRFCAYLARKHPGTIWHITDDNEPTDHEPEDPTHG